MNRRLLPLALVLAPALLAYACSSSSSKDEPTPTPTPEAGPTADNYVPPGDSSMKMDTSMMGDTSMPSSNPIEGNPAVSVVIDGPYFEGPQWVGDSLYMSAFSDGQLLKFVPSTAVGATNPDKVRDVVVAGNIPLGTALDEKTVPNTLVTLEVTNGAPGGSLVRTPITGALPRTGTPIVLTLDAAVPTFDSPNDLVVRKSDGTIYMTDPGYQTPDNTILNSNHIWRVKPTTMEVFETRVEGRPNGIALSPDDKTLYVSFTQPITLPPVIMKYTVATDGTLGAGVKFADVTPNTSTADGLAVDANGNVYVAVANGVDVFKADGLSKWGHITTTKVINGLAFGNADKKTLFMTSDSGLLKVTLKIAGLNQ